jgi:2-polyprenyl-3-methyl-5-hydroxy-6-metoxy-1,4-benzoquinol methylase
VEHENSIIRSFGPRAEAYLTSEVHSQVKDLSWLANAVATTEHPAVLDLGCGAGHASFAVAPLAQQVTAYDLTQSMLDIVATTACDRKIAPTGGRRLSAIRRLQLRLGCESIQRASLA